MTRSISAAEARRNLYPLIKQVNDDRIVVEIHSLNGDAVLISREEYESLAETDYLMRSPANAGRLRRSIEDARSGRHSEHDWQQV